MDTLGGMKSQDWFHFPQPGIHITLDNGGWVTSQSPAMNNQYRSELMLGTIVNEFKHCLSGFFHRVLMKIKPGINFVFSQAQFLEDTFLYAILLVFKMIVGFHSYGVIQGQEIRVMQLFLSRLSAQRLAGRNLAGFVQICLLPAFQGGYSFHFLKEEILVVVTHGFVTCDRAVSGALIVNRLEHTRNSNACEKGYWKSVVSVADQLVSCFRSSCPLYLSKVGIVDPECVLVNPATLRVDYLETSGLDVNLVCQRIAEMR